MDEYLCGSRRGITFPEGKGKLSYAHRLQPSGRHRSWGSSRGRVCAGVASPRRHCFVSLLFRRHLYITLIFCCRAPKMSDAGMLGLHAGRSLLSDGDISVANYYVLSWTVPTPAQDFSFKLRSRSKNSFFESLFSLANECVFIIFFVFSDLFIAVFNFHPPPLYLNPKVLLGLSDCRKCAAEISFSLSLTRQ